MVGHCDGGMASLLERNLRAHADWLVRHKRGPGRVLCHCPWHGRPHGHALPRGAGPFLGAHYRCLAARGSATRGPAPRVDPGCEWETVACRSEWSSEKVGNARHRPHYCGPGRHRAGTSCVPRSVPEAITTFAQSPACFDPGALAHTRLKAARTTDIDRQQSMV